MRSARHIRALNVRDVIDGGTSVPTVIKIMLDVNVALRSHSPKRLDVTVPPLPSGHARLSLKNVNASATPKVSVS